MNKIFIIQQFFNIISCIILIHKIVRLIVKARGALFILTKKRFFMKIKITAAQVVKSETNPYLSERFSFFSMSVESDSVQIDN